MTTQNSKSLLSAWRRSSGLARGLAIAALAAGGWALSTAATPAHAGDVYWSVGVDSPGVSVGVSNAPPPRVVVRPRPVYVERAPVVVYSDHRRPRPVYVERAPVVYVEDYGYRSDRRHHRHSRWDRHDRRHDRHDRHGHGGKHRGHRGKH
ncbi:hypothetical protein [Hydrogenophaga crassostreae]|nr:hypothetical protein [Hydrogenophaga crassostreae]